MGTVHEAGRDQGTVELTCLRMYVRVTGQRGLESQPVGLDFSKPH